MAGILEPTSSTVVRSGDLKIGCLPQQMAHAQKQIGTGGSLTVFAAVENLRKETERITRSSPSERITIQTLTKNW